jgi:hypothetical protein
LASNETEKPRQKPAIKQQIIDDFDKAYEFICDKDRQRKKNRNVSFDSVFDPKNIAPKEYLQNDPTFLEKPGRLNLKNIDTS